MEVILNASLTEQVLLLVGILLCLMQAAFLFVRKYDVPNEYVAITLFGFGFVKVPTSNRDLIKHIERFRRNDVAGFELEFCYIYSTAPEWFNKYIINKGGFEL